MGFLFPFTTTFFGIFILILGLYFIIKNKNIDNQVLIAAAYIVGSEVFLRMTGGTILYEISKYSVIFFVFLGLCFSGFSKGAVPYIIFLFLLIPAVIISTSTLNFDSEIRKAIAFNISGPVCLGLASIYTFNRKITFKAINNILLSMGLPIVSCTIYLILYTSNIQDVITSTESNFQASGGYGPNQVATILGLGMFIFFSRLMLDSKTKFQMIVNLILAILITYRGILTFSRGGMITGFIMIALLIVILFFKSNFAGRLKLTFIVVLLATSMIAVWTYTSLQTNGLIIKRYANEDAAGRVKKSQLTGREIIVQNEIETFLKYPLLGIGAGKSKEDRQNKSGVISASHNEITRMLAEHGSLGIVGLLILLFMPLILYFEKNANLFLLCFLAFWFLTINHAAMRLAAPAFIYSLTLLNIQISPFKFEKKQKL
ncbi:O-antigen ligase family protein [Flavobacterium sp. PL11]|uniref:O-antigen ligase family protein n=1 Tax=Flavobacterium sp. PL11 TaxID=3071717 RepID=UPI002E121C94